MKKILFAVAFFAIGFSIPVSADTVTEEYYGEKASGSFKNPCKGYLVKVCYKKVTQIVDHPVIGVTVTETGYDGKGNVLSSNTYTTGGTVASVMRGLQANVPANASVSVSCDTDSEYESTED